MLKFLNQKLSRLLKEKHLGELLKGGATTLFLRLIGHAVGFLLIILISRVYGAKILGEYSLAITVLTISSLFVRLGFESSMVKLFAPRFAKNDWEGIKIIYIKILRIIVFSGVVVSLALFLGSDFIANTIFHKPSFSIYIKIISLLIIPLSLRLINADSYRGFKNMKGYAYSKHVSYYLYALVILSILTIWNKTDLNPISAYAIGLIVLGISSTYILYRKISSNISGPTNDKISSKSILNLSIPMLLTSASVLLSTHMIKLIMGIYEASESVGIFSATLNIVLIQSFIQAATNSIAGPIFSQVHQFSPKKELQQIANYTTNINTYLTLPITVILLLFNKPILSILGPEFVQSSDTFIIMLIGNAIAVFCGPTNVFMNMTGQQVILRNIIFIALLFSTAVAIILIPKYGIIGGAYSYCTFVVSWNIICSAYIMIKLGVRIFFWPFSKLKNKLNV